MDLSPRDSRAPQPDPHRQGKRPPFRPPSRPPHAQNLRWKPLKQQDQPAARPASPNRFESLRDQIVDLLDKELETPKLPSRCEDDPSLADSVSSSYHSSDTAVRPVETAVASPSSVHIGDEHQNDETVEDNWETHVTPTSPPKSNERVKETNQEAENKTEDEVILETPPSSPQADCKAGRKQPDKVEKVAQQAIQKIIHATNGKIQKHGQQPSTKKKNKKGGSGSKKRR